MKLNIGVIREAHRIRLNVRFQEILYLVEEIDVAKRYHDMLDEREKKWFENLTFDRMMWWSKNFINGVPKSPKELKKERGDVMRAKRAAKKEAQRVTQVCR